MERILHSPGAKLHQILEIAVVVDCSMEKQEAAETVTGLASTLKSFGETFRNVRVNVIWWKSDMERVQEIKPLAALQMSSFVMDSGFLVEKNDRLSESSGVEAEPEGLSVLNEEKVLESLREEEVQTSKTLDALAEYMRKFQARSKIVFVVTDRESLPVLDKEQVRQCMTPMLHRKWLVLHGERIDRLSIVGELQAAP